MNKSININTQQTLDAIHNEIMSNFNKQNDIQKNIEVNLKNQIDKKNYYINSKTIYKNNPAKIIEINNIIWDLEDNIQKLETDYKNIKTRKDEYCYLNDVSRIVVDYYKSPNATDTKTETQTTRTTLLDFFKPKLPAATSNVLVIETPEPKITKKDCFNKYISKIANTYNINQEYNMYENDFCGECNIEMNLEPSLGCLICLNCGYQESILIDSDKPSYKDPPKEITSFCYRRINHFNEILAQFQAKESTVIPAHIYDEINNEIKKKKLDVNKLDVNKIRKILKEIKRNNYYEHSAYILSQLNGMQTLIISPEVEEQLRTMFHEFEMSFKKINYSTTTKTKRNNILSYSYIVYKFFELLELDEYLPNLKLLKPDNLQNHDRIWKLICTDLHWEYIPSV